MLRNEHILAVLAIGLVVFFGFIFENFDEAQAVFTIDEQDGEQISSTNIGTLDVMLAPSPQFPKPKQHVALHLFFMKPDTRIPMNHIDFKVMISKDGEELYSSSGPVHTHAFHDTVSYYFSTEGWHQIDVSVLGIDHEDIAVETASFTLAIGKVDEKIPQSPQTPSISEEAKIPDWIRNNAKWWSLTQITDQDFAKGLEYLIKEGIINVPEETTSEGQAEPQMPSWLRKNAGWWSQGLLTDDEFLKSIQWLITNGFIKI